MGGRDQRSLTIFIDEEAFSLLVADARASNRTPTARATELMLVALAAQTGPRGETKLDQMVRRLNDATRASSAPPPQSPKVPEDDVVLPLPLLRTRPAAPEPQPELASERQHAALSTRGRALRAAFALTIAEAAILDVLVGSGPMLPAQIIASLPKPLQPRSFDSIKSLVSKIRRVTALGADHIRHIRGGGYTITPHGTAQILARVGEPA